MKLLLKCWIVVFIMLSTGILGYAGCTVAVVSGKGTADGRPLLWKNRDSSHELNDIYYTTGPEYRFVGVINTGDTTQIWMGINSAGLAIMNSESKDLEGTEYDDEGRFMKYVLGRFSTIGEVDGYLQSTNSAGRAVTANFGVIDAAGGAGFFETGNHTYTFFDANQSPNGVLTRANYAVTGDGSGYGYYRCSRADSLLALEARSGQLTHRYLLQTVTRDIATESVDPYPLETCGLDSLFTGGTVNRYRTVSSAVFHGVKDGEDPALATMWCILGEPIAGVAIPLWARAEVTSPGGKEFQQLNGLIRRLEEQIYPDTSRNRTIHIPEVPGILHANLQMESDIIAATSDQLSAWRKGEPTPVSLSLYQYRTLQSVLQHLSGFTGD